jgi:hypothetical protein
MKARTFYWLTTLLSGAGYAYLAFAFWAEKHAHQASFCIIKSVSGVPCPSCGSTRSVMALLEGQVEASLLDWNPLGWVIFLMLLIIPFWAIYDGLTNKISLFNAFQSMERQLRKNYFLIPFAGILALNWIWTITKGL